MFRWIKKILNRPIKSLGMDEFTVAIERQNEVARKILGNKHERRRQDIPIVFPERRHV